VPITANIYKTLLDAANGHWFVTKELQRAIFAILDTNADNIDAAEELRAQLLRERLARFEAERRLALYTEGLKAANDAARKHRNEAECAREEAAAAIEAHRKAYETLSASHDESAARIIQLQAELLSEQEKAEAARRELAHAHFLLASIRHILDDGGAHV
jgi:hypothetical protein